MDLDKLRKVTAELGYQPATLDEEHLDKLRADNERHDWMNAHDPQGTKWQKMGCKPVDSNSGTGRVTSRTDTPKEDDDASA